VQLNTRTYNARVAGSRSRPDVDYPEVKIGSRLRLAREQVGMTLEQVAGAAGLTKGYLSQIERDLSSPSLSALWRLCAVLGIRTGDLTEPSVLETLPVRVERRPIGSDGVNQHFGLSDFYDPRFFAAESRIPPGAGAGSERYSIPGDLEFVYILKGRLEFHIRNSIYMFRAGDSFTYPIREPHTWRNPSTKRYAHVLWVAIPNAYRPSLLRQSV
jgi:transcriptional regulator with XRE-family HTH domain